MKNGVKKQSYLANKIYPQHWGYISSMLSTIVPNIMYHCPPHLGQILNELINCFKNNYTTQYL